MTSCGDGPHKCSAVAQPSRSDYLDQVTPGGAEVSSRRSADWRDAVISADEGDRRMPGGGTKSRNCGARAASRPAKKRRRTSRGGS